MPQRARNLGRNIWLDWNGNQWNLVRGLFPSRLGALAIRILPQARPFPPEPRVPSSPFSRNAQQLRTDSCPGSGILWPLQENVSNGFLALFSFRPYKQALKDSVIFTKRAPSLASAQPPRRSSQPLSIGGRRGLGRKGCLGWACWRLFSLLTFWGTTDRQPLHLTSGLLNVQY